MQISFRKGGDDGNSFAYLINYSNDGSQVRFFIGQNDSYYDYVTASAPSAGVWHHIVGTADGTTVAMYIDGLLVDSTTQTATLVATDNPLCIGSYSNDPVSANTCNDSYFAGTIDNVRVYDYARTPAQIAWDYSKGAPLVHYKFDECQNSTLYDASGSGVNGTITIGGSGTQTTVGDCSTSSTAWGNGSSGKRNNSLNFDGSDDYAAVSYNSRFDQTSNFSMSFWFSPTTTYDTNSTQENSSIVSRSQRVSNYSAESDWAFFMFTGVGQPADNDDGRMRFGTYGGNIQTATDTWTGGQWYHITLVYNSSSNVRIYVNGKLDNYSSDFDAGAIDGSLNNPLEFGRAFYDDSADEGYFPGKIDDFKIYNYPLTETQVKQNYQGGAVTFN